MLLSPPASLPRCLRPHSLRSYIRHQTIRYNAVRYQPFHSTSPSSAAPPSPEKSATLRPRVRNVGIRPAGRTPNDAMMFNRPLPKGFTRDAIRLFDQRSQLFWSEAVQLRVPVSEQVFLRVGRQLLERSCLMAPTEMAVRSISTDADLLFQIGFASVTAWGEGFPWLASACARAGSRLAILFSAAMYLHSCASEDTLDNAVLRDVKRLAVVEKEPRAMVLHAVVLSRQGRDEDALALLRPALQNICPSLTIPSVDRDALLTNCLPIPWEVYAHSAKAVGDHKGAAEVQRIAAVEYQSPNAMMEYARDLLEEQDDFDQYESFMCRAATSSHSEASFSLANFYYLAYLDLHPITLERISVKEKTPESKTDRVVAAEARVAKERRMMKDSAKRETFLNQVVSFARSAFDTSRSRDEMRQLAMNWYDFAYECGNFKAALLLARIQHQKGQTEKAIELLSAAERDRSLLNPVRKLRFAWENGTTEPKIPDRWLHI